MQIEQLEIRVQEARAAEQRREMKEMQIDVKADSEQGSAFLLLLKVWGCAEEAKRERWDANFIFFGHLLTLMSWCKPNRGKLKLKLSRPTEHT